MPDIYNKEKRSIIMSGIRSKHNTSTELKLISIFHNYGISGWRRNYKVKGHPDFVFIKKKIAIFVDGCFWHGHNCRNTKPKTNADFWEKKIQYNIMHDQKVNELFHSRRWVVIRIWECELKGKNFPEKLKILLEKAD